MHRLIVGLLFVVSVALAGSPGTVAPVETVPEPVKMEVLDEYTSAKVDEFIKNVKDEFEMTCVKETAEGWKATNITTDLEYVVKLAVEREGWKYSSEGPYRDDFYVAEFDITGDKYETGLIIFLFKEKDIYANVIILCAPTS